MKLHLGLSIVVGSLLFGASAAHANGKGNGGAFTEQTIFLKINEIAGDLIDLAPIGSFGLNGELIRSELKQRNIFVKVTPKDLYEEKVITKASQRRNALSYGPGDVPTHIADRYDIPESHRHKRVIIAHEGSWEARIRDAKDCDQDPVKQLTTHELYRAFEVNDDGYAESSLFLAKLQEISKDPTAFMCLAYCLPSQYQQQLLRGFGTTKQRAFENIHAQCATSEYRGRLMRKWENGTEVSRASEICKLNVE